MIEGISWQWVFWLNVPVGIALVPLAITQLRESHGPEKSLDLPGLALASAGLLGVVWGLVNGNGDGWASPSIVASLLVGAALLVAFVLWELRTPKPMLPMRFFRNRGFAAANGASLAMSFGMFGSIFLLTQFFQTAQGYSPLEAGLRVLPWTAMPMVVAPIAGVLSDKIGSRPILATGLALQAIGLAWIAAVSTATVGYTSLVGPFILSGIGMGLFFAPMANVILSSVQPVEEGKASGANSAVREVGGVFGVAVLASVFSRYGGYASAGDVQRRSRRRDVGRRGRRRLRRARRAGDPRQGEGGSGRGRARAGGSRLTRRKTRSRPRGVRLPVFPARWETRPRRSRARPPRESRATRLPRGSPARPPPRARPRPSNATRRPSCGRGRAAGRRCPRRWTYDETAPAGSRTSSSRTARPRAPRRPARAAARRVRATDARRALARTAAPSAPSGRRHGAPGGSQSASSSSSSCTASADQTMNVLPRQT